MNLTLYSDLHLEMQIRRKGTLGWVPQALDADVVILAGDIGSHTNGIEWAAKAFRQCPVSPEIIYVAGNHEYYGARLHSLTAQMRKTADQLGVHFLENNTVEIDGVRFIGSTLWSDFELHGDAATGMHEARNHINDYAAILGADHKPIEPEDTLKLHRKAKTFLEHELTKPFDGKTVVVTHFAPHRDAVERRFEGGALTPYFTVDMAPLMRKYPIALWAFGHTHYNVDFVEHGCRVISNQLGYPREHSQGFREDLLIEV